jgi:hypothetical protein
MTTGGQRWVQYARVLSPLIEQPAEAIYHFRYPFQQKIINLYDSDSVSSFRYLCCFSM